MVESEVKRARNLKPLKIGCAILGAGFLFVVLFYGGAVCDFLKVYGFESLQKPKKHAYSADSEKNLKALYTAMSLYHESEGQYPDATGWMDGLKGYLQSNDLQKGEGQKKLIRPDLIGQDGKFGYAMNDVASAKYKDDIKTPKETPLIYESKDTERNAHGDPAAQRDGLAISMTGEILKN